MKLDEANDCNICRAANRCQSMAPQEDDFILTISDDDQELPPSDEERSVFSEALTQRNQTSKKRKRGTETDGFLTPHLMNGAMKKQKHKLGGKLKHDGIEEQEREHEEAWADGGEDDGAMNPDFEFQIGNMEAGVVEGLDAWGINGDETGFKNKERKKGVDIDELIARRRRAGGEDRRGVNGGNDDGDNSDEGSEGSEKEESVFESNGTSASGEEREGDRDETLAADGFGMGAVGDDGEDEDAGLANGDEESESLSISEEGSIAEPVPHPDDEMSDATSISDEDDPEEQIRREAFFAPEETSNKSKSKNQPTSSFQSMSLSRPILRGLATLGFSGPTPIQAKTIPVALLGKDIVGGAVTGSGKTAAFIIPILERLLYRPKKIPTSRVAILMPTRELAVQCFTVARKLASYTDITFCQLVGGFSLREQENVLKKRPDIIIATPGRFIDHMRNSASFTVETLEILVLDEADRMLEDGFADELNEILTTIPKSRQTMLFSATVTDQVDKLVRLGLNRPVRLLVDAKKQTVTTLIQEFVRLRPGKEDKRLAYLLHLCSTVFTSQVIIFFRSKKEAHRVRIIFGLCGIKAGELHGSMSQEQVCLPSSLFFLHLHCPELSYLHLTSIPKLPNPLKLPPRLSF